MRGTNETTPTTPSAVARRAVESRMRETTCRSLRAEADDPHDIAREARRLLPSGRRHPQMDAPKRATPSPDAFGRLRIVHGAAGRAVYSGRSGTPDAISDT